eukprot:MONOS_11789.1-p1 / transcript=MONOS_11789.1 / gene=MONOS_11789 / organism=Monocercomonoides_exilis_PA203 / gene_product=unspecified product / transcript_product=unspecified product / location=Mono_scaffold00611:21605-22645(+) / protein_length=321 / sequence_SO=supercontig / SO=protein_coding / is_pseudo=false
MIVDEDKKDEKKNEKMLIDLCECYLLLRESNYDVPDELVSICIRCLLKAALCKEESEEVRKEVEMALLALSNIGYGDTSKEPYLSEIKEIILYHQEHRNLTRLAYQSAWSFLFNRLFMQNEIEDVVGNELHYVREVSGELDEIRKWVEQKNEEKEEEMKRKDEKMRRIAEVWLRSICSFFSRCKVADEVAIGMVADVTRLCRTSRENERMIFSACLNIFKTMLILKCVKIEALLKGGASKLAVEVLQQSTLTNLNTNICFKFCLVVSERLEKKMNNEMEAKEMKRVKMEFDEEMEEEGYEDTILSLNGSFYFFRDGKIVY